MLRVKFASDHAEWEVLANKALKWLKHQLAASAVSIDEQSLLKMAENQLAKASSQ